MMYPETVCRFFKQDDGTIVLAVAVIDVMNPSGSIISRNISLGASGWTIASDAALEEFLNALEWSDK
jgi:hypothetical protein